MGSLETTEAYMQNSFISVLTFFSVVGMQSPDMKSLISARTSLCTVRAGAVCVWLASGFRVAHNCRDTAQPP